MQLLESAAMCCVAVGQCPWLGLQGLYVQHGGRILVDVYLESLGTLLPSSRLSSKRMGEVRWS
jgi:hypothetical protein